MIVWQPSPERIAGTRLTAFARFLASRGGEQFADYDALHQFSVRETSAFWTAMWDFCEVIGDPGARAATDLDRMPGARFFPDARLSFSENVLRRQDDEPAILAFTEAGSSGTMSFAELRRDVSRAAAALRREGVRPGDRVAAIVGNVPEAIVAALGAAAVGAIWSSCSPDFGAQGILDRFGQVEPVVLFAVDRYQYGGKTFDCLAKLAGVRQGLPTVRACVIIPMAGRRPDAFGQSPADVWSEWLAPPESGEGTFERFPFNHPLYILFSSGTTGIPKCIVHGAGGTLLQHLKEHQLQCDIRHGDRVFYFTTTSWMMWNWLVTVPASGAAIVLFDGSPMYREGEYLFELADRVGFTLFGTSAKFLDAIRKGGLAPRARYPLASVRTITSTGSPLAPESFDFVYRDIKADVHLASISGGTDIVGCFVGGNPNAPVWRGEIQSAHLGMDVDVFDAAGRSIRATPGELVCKSPFPSMPVAFWNDPDGRKYRAAYFERFPGVWWHGDWIEATVHGGYIIYGRSDATLKPGGVRIGTAEIYRQVEQLPEVLESLAVGQQWEGDERIVLFVRLRDGLTLDDTLRGRIAAQIRANATPRHVPARILQIADIPRTKSGKMVELAVRSVIHHQPVENREALANPEALDLYRDLPELQR